jgi:hypothetical protein
MAEPVDVPGIGRVPRTWLYVGGALVVGIVGYAWLRRSRTAAVTTDPATGSTGGTGGFTNPNPGASGDDDVNTVGPDGPPTTNAQWSDRVQSTLGNIWEAGFVVTVLGKYLGGQPLTSTEADLVRSAWALHGMPPVNPPAIVMVSTASTPGTPSTPPPSSPPPSSPPPAAVRTYTVRSGDTLSGIASRHGVSTAALYTRNSAVIEAEAKKRNKSSSRGGPNNSVGWWIWPGTVLTIP